MATTVDGFRAEIERIMWPLWRDGNLVSRRLYTVEDARHYQRAVANIQAELRGLKQTVDRHAQQLRMDSGSARPSGNGSPHPLMRLLGSRKAANHTRVMDRQLEQEQEQERGASQPYEALSDHIDACIQMFERTKLAIDEAIQRGKVR